MIETELKLLRESIEALTLAVTEMNQVSPLSHPVENKPTAKDNVKPIRKAEPKPEVKAEINIKDELKSLFKNPDFPREKFVQYMAEKGFEKMADVPEDSLQETFEFAQSLLKEAS